MRFVLVLAICAAAVVAVSGWATPSPAVVASVTDGDTVRLANGRRVRLLQIDTPEVGTGECFSRAAKKALLRLVPEGSAVGLTSDPALDRVDRYGRLLRYLWRGPSNVNLELVRQGAAAPYFYGGDRGRYASRLLAAAHAAKAARRGLWGACPGTELDPSHQVETRPTDSTPRPVTPRSGCDPSYPTVCIPPYPPDLDCADVPHKRFKVVGTDPHGFDGDRDGVGCET
ncbi:MAG TPA: thermonuclease family protein [Gaiellaceae bacterium]|nr:thermonuclease family protein [Gaiellaceae bacterium]